MKIITIFLVSWVVGLAAYVGALALFYRQSISSGDLTAVLFWSILAFAVAFFALYLPALHAMRRWLRGVRPLWPFPLLAVLLGVVPTAAIVFFFSGSDVRSLASSEATLFYSMFGAAGIVVGLGYAFVMTVPPDKALQLTAKPRPPLSLVDWCRTMKALITSIVEICYWMLLWMLVGYLYGHIFGDNNWHIIPVAGAIYGTLAGFIFSLVSYFYRKNFNSLNIQTASIIGLVASMCSMVPVAILFVVEFWWAVVFGILAGLISGMLVFVSLKTKFYCQSGTADKRMHSDAAEPRR